MGWRFIDKSNISDSSADIVILMIEKLSKDVLDEIYGIGYGYEDVIHVNVLRMPGFNFDDYIKIKRNPPTIFAPMCWGGVTYHSLGLRFESPFINMFLKEDDYMMFINSPKEYMQKELEYKETAWNEIMKKNYPVAQCGDIELHFNHYDSFEKAKSCWDTRKKRIKWDNILAMMFTDKREVASSFLKYNFNKMIVFTSFEMNDNRSIYMNLSNFPEEMDLWTAVNETAKGRYLVYDVFRLLEKGEISYLSELI